MSRSARATAPSLCRRSTWPRISSVAESTDWCASRWMPNGRSMMRTSFSAASVTGPNSDTAQCTGFAIKSDMRSGELIATVFGISSAKTMTRSDIAIVA